MFDVFHNVFGKKKTGAESGRPGADDDAFVMLGNTQGDRTVIRDTDVNPNDMPPPFDMFQNLSVKDRNNQYGFPVSGAASIKTSADDSAVNIMSIQDVPFCLNSSLNVPKRLDKMWREIAPCINSIVDPSSFLVEYDFSLERAVLSETIVK